MDEEQRNGLVIQADRAYQDAVANPAAGRRSAKRVADDARTAGNPEALVVALRAAGWAARELYDHESAQRYLDEAVDVARDAGLDDRLCEVLITRASTHLEVGNDRQARRDLAAARTVAGHQASAEVAFAHGLLEDETGNYSAALSAYRRTLELVADDRPHLRVKTLNNLAMAALRLGRYQQAEQRLEQAAGLAATFSPMATALVAQSQARLAIESGKPVEAMRRYDRAEELLRAAELPLVELHMDRASAFLTLRLLDEAAAAAAQAVRGYERHVGGSLMLAEALVVQARVALAQDQRELAMAAAVRAEHLFRQQRRPGFRAVAVLLKLKARVSNEGITPGIVEPLARLERTMRRLGNVPSAVEAGLLLGEVSASLGHIRRATSAYDRVVKECRRGPVILRLQGRTAAARRAEIDGDMRRVSQLCRTGLKDLAAYRAAFASAELRAKAAGHGQALAAMGLRSALQSGHGHRIWTWIERIQATALLCATSPVGSEHLQAQLSELRMVEKDITALGVEDLAERAALLRRITKLERTIRSATWAADNGTAAWTVPTAMSLHELRADLGQRTLLQYGELDGRLLGVAVTRRALRWADLGPAAAVAHSGQQLAFALRRLSQPRSSASVTSALSSARRELASLADTLIAPFASAVEGAREIIVAAPATLLSIPWGVVPLLGGGPVRVVPAAASWHDTVDCLPASDNVVLVAGPDLDGAPAEVAAIASRYPAATQYVGPDASCEAVRAAAAGARMVHLACHGRLRADSAGFSSLRLEDGPLTVHDLEHLPQPAHHWVLAACDMGSPGQVSGGALEGVLAALLSGGAAGIVAAIVSVPDVPTAELMIALHGELARGATLSEAMRSARRSIDTTDPMGFVTGMAFSCYGGG